MRKIFALMFLFFLFTECASVSEKSFILEIPKIDEQIENLSIEEKVAQLFIVEPEALEFSDDEKFVALKCSRKIKKNLEKYSVGGIIFFKQNITGKRQFKKFISDFQKASEIPLFIAADEEGGNIVRLAKEPSLKLPEFENASKVALKGEAEVFEMAATIGEYLKEYGVNFDFAPVADINSNPENTVIGERAFGSDCETVSRMVAVSVKGFHSNNIAVSLKHFPGHGDTVGDTHYGCASSEKNYLEISDCELKPFISGINEDADSVMVAHITTPKVFESGKDRNGNYLPATLSYFWQTEVLRRRLGFKGLIVTDSLGMGAIKNYYTPEESAVMALKAGSDIILMPEDFERAYYGILDAVRRGEISESRINESVKRILLLKAKRGIIKSF